MNESGPKRYKRGQSLRDKIIQDIQTTNVVGECWEFTGRRTGQRGYGQIWHEGRWHYAHRVSYTFFVGPIPEKYDIDHLCRNTRCIRPAHLEAVTHQVNIQRGVDARRNAA